MVTILKSSQLCWFTASAKASLDKGVGFHQVDSGCKTYITSTKWIQNWLDDHNPLNISLLQLSLLIFQVKYWWHLLINLILEIQKIPKVDSIKWLVSNANPTYFSWNDQLDIFLIWRYYFLISIFSLWDSEECIHLKVYSRLIGQPVGSNAMFRIVYFIILV